MTNQQAQKHKDGTRGHKAMHNRMQVQHHDDNKGQALEKTNRNITQGDSKVTREYKDRHRRTQGQAQKDSRTGTRGLKDRHKRKQGSYKGHNGMNIRTQGITQDT